MKINMSKEKIKKIVLLLILASCILPVLIVTFYGLPSADDFSNTLPFLSYSGNKFKYMFWSVADLYKRWQGTYLGCFLAAFPSYHILGLFGLHIEMFINAILFFLSVFICVKAFIQKIDINKKELHVTILLFTTIVIFYVLGTNQLSETFYWHTGLCVYTIPLSCTFFAISCYLRYAISNMKKWVVIGLFFALCGAGGALNISAFLCAVLLFFILYDFIIVKEIRLNSLIFLSALFGSIINAIAPGNYLRHSAVDSELRLGNSIISVILRINNVLISEFQSGILLVIIVIAFVSSYKKLISSSFEFRHPILVTIYCYWSIFITDFPVILGYSSSTLPVRCAFIEHVSIIVFVLVCTVYWSGWASQKKLLNFSTEWILTLVLICTISASNYLNSHNFIELTPYKMIYHLVKGDYTIETNNQKEIISQIENSSEEDVIVKISMEDICEWTNLKTMGLTEDASWWVNTSIASYYNKNSVVLQYIE